MYAQILQSASAIQLTLQCIQETATHALLQTNHKTCHKHELPQKRVLPTIARTRCFLSLLTSKFKIVITIWILEIPWQLS